MAAPITLAPAFRDPVRQSQSIFRAAMDALARPGTIVSVAPELVPPAPLLPPAAALLLTLCDFETTVWLDRPLASARAVFDFLRFHTGVRIVAASADAGYAVISDATSIPPLDAFAQGTPDYPDQSTTLIIQVETLTASGWALEGPGIRDRICFSAGPLPGDFVAQLRANRSRFPRGVDLFFTTPTQIAALPRSTRLTGTD